jgi:ABC-type glycerol-3-phosphate transport system permease component
MDGATGWQTFRYITLPAIRNTLLVVGILQVILSLQVFDLLYLLTGGGPGRETTVMSYYIYERMVMNLSFGYSSAMALILTLLTLAFSGALLYLRLRERPASVQEQAPDARPAAASEPGTAIHVTAADLAATASGGDPPPRRWIRIPRWLSVAGLWIGTAVLFLWFVGPVAWMTIASLQPEGAITTAPPQLTTDIRFDRYLSLLEDPRWQSSLLISLEVTIATTLIVLVLAALAAFPLARLAVPGKGLLMVVLIITQMVPAIVLAIPVLMVFQRIGLKDTPLALIIVNVAFWLPLIIWLLRNVIQDVPRSLEAAARMDGLSRIGSLFRVVLPAARPGIAAAAILVLIGTWNEFLFAVILGNRNAVPITRLITGIQNFPGALNQQPPPNLLAAAAIVAVAPCLLLVVFFHRRIITGLTGGFVKG